MTAKQSQPTARIAVQTHRWSEFVEIAEPTECDPGAALGAPSPEFVTLGFCGFTWLYRLISGSSAPFSVGIVDHIRVFHDPGSRGIMS
jgi:hypothetical protein